MMSRSDITDEIYKPARKTFKRRVYSLRGISDLIEFDLAEFQTIAKQNDGFRYVLTGLLFFERKNNIIHKIMFSNQYLYKERIC